jgi:hypothetical protein
MGPVAIDPLVRRRRWLIGGAWVSASGWLIAVAVASSDAGVAFPAWMALFAFGVMLAAGWLLWMAVGIARAGKHGTSRVIRTIRAGLVIPVVISLAVLLGATHVALEVRLYLSRDALLQAAPSLAQMSSRELWFSPRWVGLFRVREFSQFGGELRFLTSECGVVDTCGVVYSPSGPPPNRGEDSFRHLYGPWWHWHQSW